MNKTCPVCGADFEASTRNQKYCCVDCREQAIADRRGWQRRVVPREFACVECGQRVVVTEAKDQRTMYCCRQCKARKAQREYQKAMPDAVREKLKERQRKYSMAGKEARDKNRMVVRRTCEFCGQEYVAKNGNQKYCSKQCGQKAAGLRQRKSALTFVCKGCGKTVEVEYGDKRNTFCSDNCAHRYSNRIRRHNEGSEKRIARFFAKRKKVIRQRRHEKIVPRKVFERDGWVCGICGKRIDKRLKWPNLKAATVDHIVPISAGGTHTYDNVQAAHFICNSRKSGNVDQVQPLLIGRW